MVEKGSCDALYIGVRHIKIRGHSAAVQCPEHTSILKTWIPMIEIRRQWTCCRSSLPRCCHNHFFCLKTLDNEHQTPLCQSACESSEESCSCNNNFSVNHGQAKPTANQQYKESLQVVQHCFKEETQKRRPIDIGRSCCFCA